MMEATERTHSSLSEFDTSSDSDWLDVSSRASEDNDSVTGFYDSDREDTFDRPASRGSLGSLTSSRSGVVEGWEGLIDDSADEATPDALAGDSFSDSDDNARCSSPAEDDPEEERVKAGLEQSMMSTLSSSRSNSLANSVQTSVVRSTRDLRLSFPDPLTSSRDQLLNSSSYEDVSAPNSDTSSIDADNAGREHTTLLPAPGAADPGPVATSEVPPNDASEVQRPNVPSGIIPDFFIALYGPSFTAKDAIVGALLQKWALGAGLVLSCSLSHPPGVTTRIYIPKDGVQDHTSRRFVSIVDKTDLSHSIPNEPSPTCPSLALVLLPSVPSINLSAHTLYLPILVPNPLTMVDVFTSTDSLLDAEQQWESLSVSPSKLTALSGWPSAVVDQEKLETATPIQIHNTFKPLLRPQRPIIKKTFSTHAILLAMLSMVIGYIVKGTVSSGAVLERSWGLEVPANGSSITSATTSVATIAPNSVFVPNSAKDIQVVPLTPTSAATSALRQAGASTAPASTSALTHDSPSTDAPTECTCGCGMVTWSGKMLSTDLIARPAASAPALSANSGSGKAITSILPSNTRGYTRNGKGKAKAFEVGDASLYALSTRLAGSISEYFDFKTLLGVTKKDVQELLDALQVLYEVIGRQTAVAMEQSRSSLEKLTQQLKREVKQVKEEVKHRNAHAKVRARELKDKGREYFLAVRERIRTRTELAKERAKVFKESFKNGEMKEWKIRRSEARQLRKLRRWERKHFHRRPIRVY